MSFKRLLKERITQTILLIALFAISSSYLPLEALRGLYTMSTLIKDVLMFFLPLVVCVYISSSLAQFGKKAPLFIITLMVFEACSNGMSVWYAYGFGGSIYDIIPAITGTTQDMNSLKPYFALSLWRPVWWTASKGTMVGICIGLFCAFFSASPLNAYLQQARKEAEFFLTKVFSRLIPIFVLGFIANMFAMNIFEQLLAKFAFVVFLVVIALGLYITFLFFAASAFHPSKAFKSFLNLAPAAGMALTSGCSICTMPLTIQGTSRNLRKPDLAKMVIPATTNIQQIGDCILNCLLCLVILKHFGKPWPDVETWLQFSIVFTLARFATAAVLGGAIFVMLPIYEAYLGFNNEMIALILAFNVLLDPLVTTTNVISNGALCQLFEKLWHRIENSRIGRNINPPIEPPYQNVA